MKKGFTLLLFVLLLFFSTIFATASEVSFEEKMKGIEGKYTLSVQVKKWTNDPHFAGMDFPDTSIVHTVEIEIKYDGEEPNSGKPLFSVYVNGQKTDNVTVGPSSSGNSGIFVTANDLPVPSLGVNRTIKGSARFDYSEETSKYTYSQDKTAVLIRDASENIGSGSTTIAPVPVTADETDGTLTSDNNSAGGLAEGEEGLDKENSTSGDLNAEEEEEVIEEEIIEEEVIEEEVIEEEEEEEEEENQQIPRGITFVKGIVEVKRAGSDKWIRARKSMPLNAGDTVRTGKNSYAELGCSSSEFSTAAGSEIRMNSLSILTVPDRVLKVERKSRVRVVIDDAIKNVYSLFGKEEFEVETPSAVCGIRGTDFIIDVDEDGNTVFLLREGSIHVKNIYDNSEVTLKPGQKVLSSIDIALTVPEEQTAEDEEAFNTNYYDTTEVGTLGFIGIVVIGIIIILIITLLLKKKKKRQS